MVMFSAVRLRAWLEHVYGNVGGFLDDFEAVNISHRRSIRDIYSYQTLCARRGMLMEKINLRFQHFRSMMTSCQTALSQNTRDTFKSDIKVEGNTRFVSFEKVRHSSSFFRCCCSVAKCIVNTNMGSSSSVVKGNRGMSKQFLGVDTIYVPEITAPQLGKILLRKCGNEGRHPYLTETEKVTLKFLRAAIDFIPLALEVGGDLANASFFFAHPGNDFALKAGKENWEFYFSQLADGTIQGRCVRRPTLNYIWDEFKKVISRYVGTALLALTAS